MRDKQPSIFEKLKKRNKTDVVPARVRPVIFFKLQFDDNGAYLQVVDKNSKTIDAPHEYYSGATRGVLKTIESIKEKEVFKVNFETSNECIYLAENEYLLWQLKNCHNFVDKKFNPIDILEDTAEIVVHIKEGSPEEETIGTHDGVNRSLSTDITLKYQNEIFHEIRFISESYVLGKGEIYRVPPVSENFREIHLFKTSFASDHVENYLTLLFTNFDNIAINYKDYKLTTGEPKQTQSAVIFEKIDSGNMLHMRVSPSLPGFAANFLEDYDITRVAFVNDLEKKIVIHDVVHEEIHSCYSEITRLLKKHKREIHKDGDFFMESNFFILEEGLAREFIFKELTYLISRYRIYGADKLKLYKIRAVTPRLTLSLSHGIDFLEGDAHLEIEGQLISLFDVLNQIKKNSYISLNDGTHAIVNRDYINRLQRIFKKKDNKVRVSFFDLPIIEDLIDDKIAEDSFTRSREIFLGFNDLRNKKTQYPKINAKLRSYQKQGYKWLEYLHQHSLGGCLADDMGLGKTVQTIALLSKIYPAEEQGSLVVMPKSLLFNWENEIKKFNPGLSFCTYHGPNRDLDQAVTKNLILTTYATIRNDIEKIKEKNFYFIILDESQNIKNIQSQSTKAIMLLQGKRRLALSGTPIENNLGELYSLFRFLNPAMFGSIEEFRRNYLNPIQKEENKEILIELKKKIYPFILRRLKMDVLKELPDKIEQVLYVDMTEEQKEFYEDRRLFYYRAIKMQIAKEGVQKSQFFILQALSELRQIASCPEAKTDNRIISPKREVIMETILDVISNNHKVLVFANFITALDTVAEELEKFNIEYLVMTGATRDRKTLVDRFQNDESAKVLLATLKTGGIGLNLTAADYIFIYDPWWNKAAENQAIDRAHRIGQDKTVFSYKLITKNSIEEKILELQKIKDKLFDSLIASDSSSIKSLREEDVDILLGE